MSKDNPKVFIDFKVGVHEAGRVVFQLFKDLTPRTAENFRGLCAGDYGAVGAHRLCYTGTKVLRIADNSLIHCGDITLNSGQGGYSIYGPKFEDQNFTRRHSCAGLLSMASKGRNSNNSQFMITLKATPGLDGKQVVFGQVIKGMEVVRRIAKVALDMNDSPRIPITIVDCGEIDDLKAFLKYDPFSKEVFDSIKEQKTQLTQVRNQIREMFSRIDDRPQQPPAAEAEQPETHPKQGGQQAAEPESQSKLMSERLVSALPEELKRRLYNVHLQLGAVKQLNNEQVVEEELVASDPKAKLMFRKKEREELQGEQQAQRRLIGVKDKSYMTVPCHRMRLRDGESGEHCAFNDQAYYRAYQKRTKKLVVDRQAYEQLMVDPAFKPSQDETRKERLAEDLREQAQKRKQFSRYRTRNEDDIETGINSRNRVYNRKLQRFYGKHVAGIAANLDIVPQKK